MPPSPELDIEPIELKARAIAEWASGESEPRDIAPPTKWRITASAGSTSSIGIGVAALKRKRPRSVQLRRVWSSIAAEYSLNLP